MPKLSRTSSRTLSAPVGPATDIESMSLANLKARLLAHHAVIESIHSGATLEQKKVALAHALWSGPLVPVLEERYNQLRKHDRSMLCWTKGAKKFVGVT